MKKLLIIFFTMIITISTACAKTVKNTIPSVIKDFGISKDSISVSIRDAKSGNVVIGINDKILMNPASVQKALTMPAAVDKLGENYQFKTSLYSRGKDEYIIKLSGDPYLKSGDLKRLVYGVKPEAKTIYIDDSALDDNIWGEGWQWDDDLNVLMPKFSAYNLDNNTAKITLIPSENGQVAISNSSGFPFLFTNNLKVSNSSDIKVKRDLSLSVNGITLNGTVWKPTTIRIPLNNPQKYFEFQLTKALENKNIYIKNPYIKSSLKSSDKLISTTEHPLDIALNDILKNSNNMAAETVFKLSGNGTADGGLNVFAEFCKKNKLDPSAIKLTDGSGVSKNNLVSTDFVSEFLFVNRDNSTLKYLPKPGEGTMTHRLLNIKDCLRVKTGTLAGVSSIAGYLTSKSGKEYCFCIIQNDVKLSESDKKMLEDYIIKELYLKG